MMTFILYNHFKMLCIIIDKISNDEVFDHEYVHQEMETIFELVTKVKICLLSILNHYRSTQELYRRLENDDFYRMLLDFFSIIPLEGDPNCSVRNRAMVAFNEVADFVVQVFNELVKTKFANVSTKTLEYLIGPLDVYIYIYI